MPDPTARRYAPRSCDLCGRVGTPEHPVMRIVEPGLVDDEVDFECEGACP